MVDYIINTWLFRWIWLKTVRTLLYKSRMKHIDNGVDWRFYEQYSVKEILAMKLDGSEDDKQHIYSKWRR